jgi:muramidase (phage lysozyme)
MNTNRRAFLDMLSVSEGTSTSPITQNNGYDVIVTGVTGPEIFTDYSQHPFVNRKPKQVKGSLYSTASGRYQHMRVHWEHYRDQLNLPDFGPESQDLWAIQLIRERGALPLIDAGKFDLAVSRVRNIWASLPGAGYGQPEHKIEKLRAAYVAAGGVLA